MTYFSVWNDPFINEQKRLVRTIFLSVRSLHKRRNYEQQSAEMRQDLSIYSGMKSTGTKDGSSDPLSERKCPLTEQLPVFFQPGINRFKVFITFQEWNETAPEVI